MGKKGRVFLRGMTSEQYGLKEFRRAQLDAPRVRGDDVVVDNAKLGHSGDSKDSRTWWRIGPGDDPFLTQNIQVHFVELPPGKSNKGHGHQNEAAGSRSGKHWHMADEVLYIISGSGHSLHWEVEAEIDERYYARVAKEPTRHEFQAGDTVYVPQNTIHQHFSSDDEPVVLLSAQNRLIKYLGYDRVVQLEDAPEFAGEPQVAVPAGGAGMS